MFQFAQSRSLPHRRLADWPIVGMFPLLILLLPISWLIACIVLMTSDTVRVPFPSHIVDNMGISYIQDIPQHGYHPQGAVPPYVEIDLSLCLLHMDKEELGRLLVVVSLPMSCVN